MEPCFLTAAQGARLIREEKLTSETLVRSCLERISDRDPAVKAWIDLHPAYSLACAREMDKRPPTLSLHGLPIGVKDVFDTADMPTTHNSPIFKDHRPARDAASVSILRSNGAVLLGKTDTVEFAACGRKAATRHPLNSAHTPGGSSSGSAAAVGDCQVPLALGTQTGGSLIRPASFNGIYALKPTWGAVSREGVKQLAAMLDTVGWYGRSVEDLALPARAFRFQDLDDAPVDVAALRVGCCRSTAWSSIEPSGEKALNTAAERLRRAGAVVRELELPEEFSELLWAHGVILTGEAKASLLDLYLSRKDLLSDELVEKYLDLDGAITGDVMNRAYDLADGCRRVFAQAMNEVDVLLTPAAPGEAPKGIQAGDHAFNVIWTLLHVPCLAIPCTTGDNNLPVGIQIIGPRYTDARLLTIGSAMARAIDLEKG